MNRTVRGLGVVAAVSFAGYWWASDDVRQVEAAYDDVVDMLGIDDNPGYGGRFTDDPRAACRRTREQVPLLTSRTSFGRLSPPSESDEMPAEVYPVWEAFAQRAETDGWAVRRFVAEGELRLVARRGDVTFSVTSFQRGKHFLVVTRDECRGENMVPMDVADGPLRDGFSEVDVFEQP